MKNRENKGPKTPKKERAPHTARQQAEEQALRDAKLQSCLHKQTAHKPNKKPDIQYFKDIFADIGIMMDDTKQIPQDWIPHSYNSDKQKLEFFRKFIYNYKFPTILLYLALGTMTQSLGRNDEHIANRAKKWIHDIVSGKSFYKANKYLFTRNEAHYFLNSSVNEISNDAFSRLYFHAKCKARNIDSKLISCILDVCTHKFFNAFSEHNDTMLKFIDTYLDFLSRFPEYAWTKTELADVSDFVRHKMFECRDGREQFSFSGRTIQSLIELSNIWHREMQKSKVISQEDKSWAGFMIHDGEYAIEDSEHIKYKYIVTQLLSYNALYKEGSRMKHCVAGYARGASQGDFAIFNISRITTNTTNFESMATIEVNKNFQIVQARAKCNQRIDSLTEKILRRWCSENSMSMRRL